MTRDRKSFYQDGTLKVKVLAIDFVLRDVTTMQHTVQTTIQSILIGLVQVTIEKITVGYFMLK